MKYIVKGRRVWDAEWDEEKWEHDLKGLEWRRDQFKGLIEKKWIDCDDDVKEALKVNKYIPNDWIPETD